MIERIAEKEESFALKELRGGVFIAPKETEVRFVDRGLTARRPRA